MQVVESDKEEDDEDAYMINKAPLATAMLPKFLNKPMGRPGQKPVQPMLVQPQGMNEMIHVSLYMWRDQTQQDSQRYQLGL